jgi:hypothetical protein
VKYVIDPLKGLLCTLVGLSVTPSAFVCAVFAAVYAHNTYLYLLCLPFTLCFIAVLSANYTTGQLPRWAALFATPDEGVPGDLKEPRCRSVYTMYGKYVCALYWLTVRNKCHGLAFMLGRPLPDNQMLNGDLWGFQELPNGAWRWVKRLGPIQLCAGNQTTLKRYEGIYAIPWLSIKRVKSHGLP